MEKKPIIFLDIDGVMNSNDHFKGEHGENWGDRPVKALNAIIAALAPVDIVISSSWRYWFDDVEMAAHLERNGVVGAPIIGHTMIKMTEPERGHCIRIWMKEHGNGRPYVIVDDNEILGKDHTHRFIKTEWATGLGPEHVKPMVEAIEKQIAYAEMKELAETREPCKLLTVDCECGGGKTGCADCFGDGFRPVKS